MERPHIQAPTKPASEPTKEQKDEIHKAVAPITIADDGEPKLQLCKVESKLSETLVVQNPAVSEERRRILVGSNKQEH